MFRLEWLFLLQIVMGILMMIILHKTNKTEKQIDEITKEVKCYISFVTEDIADVTKENNNIEEKKLFFEEKEDIESSLIQAVLGEYFP